MTEYIPREALTAKFKQMELGKHGLVERLFADGIYAVIAAFPAADVATVVWCRDCKHLYGTLCTVCGLLPRKPDDFCSYGEYQTNGGADHENQRN